MNETPANFSARMDRDAHYRIAALRCATMRANLRESISDDREEVVAWADFFYSWLKGNGDGGKTPQLEEKHE